MFAITAKELSAKFKEVQSNVSEIHKNVVIGHVNSVLNTAIKENFSEQFRKSSERNVFMIAIDRSIVQHREDRFAAIESAVKDLVKSGFDAECYLENSYGEELNPPYIKITIDN